MIKDFINKCSRCGERITDNFSYKLYCGRCNIIDFFIKIRGNIHVRWLLLKSLIKGLKERMMENVNKQNY